MQTLLISLLYCQPWNVYGYICCMQWTLMTWYFAEKLLANDKFLVYVTFTQIDVNKIKTLWHSTRMTLWNNKNNNGAADLCVCFGREPEHRTGGMWKVRTSLVDALHKGFIYDLSLFRNSEGSKRNKQKFIGFVKCLPFFLLRQNFLLKVRKMNEKTKEKRIGVVSKRGWNFPKWIFWFIFWS